MELGQCHVVAVCHFFLACHKKEQFGPGNRARLSHASVAYRRSRV